jgi:hypothetical protein
LNDNGQLGNGTTVNSTTPVAVSALTDAVEVDVGSDHVCARRTGGSVVCWGRGGRGELGNGMSTDSSTPVAVTGLTDAVEIATGAGFTCTRRASGTLACWGLGDSGQLGNGRTSNSDVPSEITSCNTSGVCVACAVGEVRCVDYLTRQACNADQSAMVAANCMTGYSCLGMGVCTMRTCTPGTRTCSTVGNFLTLCTADGVTLTTTVCAGSTPYCRDGRCTF